MEEIWTELSERDSPLNEAEYLIINKILRILDKRHFIYKYEGAVPRLIRAVQEIKRTPCCIEIVLKADNMLSLTLDFPGEYTFSKLVYLCIFCSEFNSKSKYAFLVPENGCISRVD